MTIDQPIPPEPSAEAEHDAQTAAIRVGVAADAASVARHGAVYTRRRWYDLVRMVLLGLVVAMVAIILWVVLVSQNTLRNNSQVNRANLTRLVDCTTPGHPCYDDSAKRTGAAIATINEVTIAAVDCAKVAPPTITEAQLRACITAKVERAKP